MRKQYLRLIETLIEEIDREGCVEVFETLGDKPTITKHDRTTSLKNLLGGWKQITEIYPEESQSISISDIRKNL